MSCHNLKLRRVGWSAYQSAIPKFREDFKPLPMLFGTGGEHNNMHFNWDRLFYNPTEYLIRTVFL